MEPNEQDAPASVRGSLPPPSPSAVASPRGQGASCSPYGGIHWTYSGKDRRWQWYLPTCILKAMH